MLKVYYIGDEINVCEIGRRCRMHGRMRNSYIHTCFGWNIKGRDHLEEQGIEGKEKMPIRG